MNSEIVFTRFWHYFCLFLKVSNVRYSLIENDFTLFDKKVPVLGGVKEVIKRVNFKGNKFAFLFVIWFDISNSNLAENKMTFYQPSSLYLSLTISFSLSLSVSLSLFIPLLLSIFLQNIFDNKIFFYQDWYVCKE